jgi:hypothetical protein
MSAIGFCGNLGKRSADGNIRIYTRDECEGTLNGIWHANGECTKGEGGSYSYDCRYLNSLPDPQPPAAMGAAVVGATAAGGSNSMMPLVLAAAVAAGAYMYMKRK